MTAGDVLRSMTFTLPSGRLLDNAGFNWSMERMHGCQRKERVVSVF